MAYRRRRTYRRYKRSFRRFGKRYFKKRFRRYINGTSKSICRLKVPMLVKTTLASVDDDGTILSKPITPWAATGDNLTGGNPFSALASPVYRQFCNLYEEVKCIGGKINISVETPIGTATIPSVTMITAWDRRMGAADQGTEAPTYDDLMTYSTAKRAVGINNSVCKIKRSLYASDLIEKAQWHDCTFTVASVTNSISDRAVEQAANNPNFFAPGMWLGMAQSGSSAADINLIVEVNWYFAFRNPKYGGAASGAKGDMRETAPMMDQEADGDADTEVLDKEVAQEAPSAKRARFVS